METSIDARKRLMLEAATRGDFGLRLCERHYFAHIEGSPQCVLRTAEQFFDVLEELNQELDNLDALTEELCDSLSGG